MMRTSLLFTASTLFASVTFAPVASAGDGVARVSVASDGSQATGSSGQYGAAISGNGRYVVFGSFANNFDPRDFNGNGENVYLHDRDPDGNGIFDEGNGTTTLVDVTLSGNAGYGGIVGEDVTPDGRFVVFSGACPVFVENDTNGSADVFLLDRDTDGNGVFDEEPATLERVSLGPDGVQGDSYSLIPTISADGRFVAFSSLASNFVSGDHNGEIDAFVRDRATGTTTRVSVGWDGQEPDGESYGPRISADGKFVAFLSSATDLVPNDTNGHADVFLYEMATGTTTLVSAAAGGGSANDESYAPRISGDGGRVVFESRATDLVADDLNGGPDVFLFERATGQVSRVSETPGGIAADAEATAPAISRDGTAVLFTSPADNLVGLQVHRVANVFLRDLVAGTIEKVSVRPIGDGDGSSFSYGLSDDHAQVVFQSESTDLVAGDTNTLSDVFVRNRTIPFPTASASNYGTGWPGTNGVPAITAATLPVFGSTATIAIENSLQFWTVGFAMAGFDTQSIVSGKGGTLLVQSFLFLPFLLPPEGALLTFDVPYDEALFGMHAYVQALELDDGASRQVSFTPGLDLGFGQ
jgi:Tol biopolymer transport system component